MQFLADIRAGAFRVEPVTHADLDRCANIVAKFAEMDLGICAAAVAVIADRIGTSRILTVDQRDFRLLRTTRGKPFRLLPVLTC